MRHRTTESTTGPVRPTVPASHASETVGLLALQSMVGNQSVARWLAGTSAAPVDSRTRQVPLRAPAFVLQRQLAPKTKFGEIDGATKMGTSVETLLPPESFREPDGTSNDPTFVPFAHMKWLNSITKPATYVQGHLLNDRLGGPGHDVRNITVFPGTPTNRDHSNLVENDIKSWLTAGFWIHYEVRAEYATESMRRIPTWVSRSATSRKRSRDGQPVDARASDPPPAFRGLPTFSFASRLETVWWRVDANGDDDAPKDGVVNRTEFEIPSPLSFDRHYAPNAPDAPSTDSRSQHPSFKGNQQVTLTDIAPQATRIRHHKTSYEPPPRWMGADAARLAARSGARPPLSPTAPFSPEQLKGWDKYWSGFEAGRGGSDYGEHLGRSYDLGYVDGEAHLAIPHAEMKDAVDPEPPDGDEPPKKRARLEPPLGGARFERDVAMTDAIDPEPTPLYERPMIRARRDRAPNAGEPASAGHRSDRALSLDRDRERDRARDAERSRERDAERDRDRDPERGHGRARTAGRRAREVAPTDGVAEDRPVRATGVDIDDESEKSDGDGE
jgi:hypothetical protein